MIDEVLMETPYVVEPHMFGAGLLVARVVFGLLMAGHGAQKLFGWFGGYGLNATGQFMVQLGYPRGRFFAAVASASEVVSGLLLALGLLGPIGPALIVAIMIVAAVTVHLQNGVFSTSNGIEVPLLFGAAAVAFGLAGYGPYSLDAVTGLSAIWTPTLTLIVLGFGVVGGIANLLIRRPTPAQA
jgi:putative oxidoreductase